jgi:transposase-like protein
LRDLPEMFVIRGIVFSHEAVREWEAKLTSALAEELRRRRKGRVLFREHRDMKAARAFFRSAQAVTGGPTGSRPMATTATRARSGLSWARRCDIAPADTATMGWNRIIVA